jgi:hypothetical protein
VTRLSILIPCLRGAEQSEETLVSVLQNRPEDCEILVPHARPYDDPYDLSDEVHFLHVPGAEGIVELINAAVERAEGDVIHTLACGTTVEEGWTEPALAHFADPHVAAVAPLAIQTEQPTRIQSLGIRYTRGGATQRVGHNQPLPRRHKLAREIVGPELTGGFFAREMLDALGGFASEVGDELADVDLALSLVELGYRTVFEPSCRLHSRDLPPKTRSGALSRGRQLERLFLRHAAAHGGIWAVLAHPLTIAADTWRELPSARAALKLLGRLIASWEFGTIAAYKQRMAEAADYLAHEPTLQDARRLVGAPQVRQAGREIRQRSRQAA